LRGGGFVPFLDPRLGGKAGAGVAGGDGAAGRGVERKLRGEQYSVQEIV